MNEGPISCKLNYVKKYHQLLIRNLQQQVGYSKTGIQGAG